MCVASKARLRPLCKDTASGLQRLTSKVPIAEPSTPDFFKTPGIFTTVLSVPVYNWVSGLIPTVE